MIPQHINRTATLAWSSDAVPLLAAGSVAGAIDASFSSAAALEIWDVFGPLPEAPLVAAEIDQKFRALAWLPPFAGRPHGVVAAALEDGAVRFWDASKLLAAGSLADATIDLAALGPHDARCILFNAKNPHVMASGGARGELLVWDLCTLAPPVSVSTVTDAAVTSVAWNNAVDHILAASSAAGHASIWDLHAQREVMRLAHPGADLACVAWHPLQLTRLVAASQSDACPAVIAWDLRNASEPERVLRQGKGVLSLDWCVHDASLLLAAGKDHAVTLWNPLTGDRLAAYPPAGNWVFAARFAPRAPDVFALASFDGSVVVRSLQAPASPPKAEAQAKSDDDFWSLIATVEPVQAIVEVAQAPAWLQRTCSASFGFGSKIVAVRNIQGKGVVRVSTLETPKADHEFVLRLSSALKTNDFGDVLEANLETAQSDACDWEALLRLQNEGKSAFLKNVAGIAEESAEETEAPEALDDDDSFFASLAKDFKSLRITAEYVPSGSFSITDLLRPPAEGRLARLLLANRIPEAVSVCLDEDRLLEALVLALDSDDSIKNKVRSRFFEQTQSDYLSRLIYSASSKNVEDIVQNAEISNWKEIAASITNYCKDDADFRANCVALGDRILSASDSNNENRRNALLCFLAGGALDKALKIWLADLPLLERLILTSKLKNVSSPHDARYLALAGFVEKISVYRSLLNLTGPLAGASIEPVCKAVFEFSSMAAANADFELANQYLSLLPEAFPGLKLEKERIAKATASSSESMRMGANGGTQKNRYTASRASSTVGLYSKPPFSKPSPKRPFPPAIPTAAKAPIGPAQSQPFAPTTAPVFTAPSNPYMPGGGEKRGSFGGYNFTTQNNLLGISPNPVPLTSPMGQIRPPSTPAFTQNLQPTLLNVSGAHASVPSTQPNSAMYKPDTEGWNDLPDTFKASKPVSRRAAASFTVPAPSPSLSAAPVPQVHPPKRPQASHLIAPPPKAGSRSVSKSSVPGTPRIASSSKPSKYAPPVPSSPALPPNGSSPVQAQKVAAPPKNPYAPAAVATTKTTYATPPVNNFVSSPATNLSRSATTIINPYSPDVARPGLRSVSNSSIAGMPSQGIVPPVPRLPSASSRQNSGQLAEGSFAPPPRVASGRYSSSQIAQTNGNGSMPPPATALNQYAPQSTATTNKVLPPPAAAQYAPPPPAAAQYAPPPAAAAQYAPPPPAAAQYAPPPPAAAQYAPPPPAAAQYAPPPPAAAAAQHAPPPVGAVNSFEQTASAPTGGIPTPPVAGSQTKTPSISSGRQELKPSADLIKPQPNSTAHATTIVDTIAQDPNSVTRSFIKENFGVILGKIKPAAPPKYAKHVLDMEKRLGILFEHLSKQTLLTTPTIELLNDVAKALEQKNYQRATAFHQRIGQDFPSETGDWHTGVKRLVTMAEAFEI